MRAFFFIGARKGSVLMNKMFEILLSYFLTTLLVLNNWARIIMGFKDQSGIVFLCLCIKGVVVLDIRAALTEHSH